MPIPSPDDDGPLEEPVELTEFEILKRGLTVDTRIYASSSYPHRVHRVITEAAPQEIIAIGEGTQGTIFEMTGDAMVVKKEKPGHHRLWPNLYDEFTLHIHVALVFDRFREEYGDCDVRIPRPSHFIPAGCDAFWNELLDRFPPGYRRRTDVMVMQKILPLPKRIRRALVTLLHPPMANGAPVDPAIIQTIVDHPANKYCLVRPYLGQYASRPRTELRSLLNLSIGLDEMEALDVDVKGLARRLGEAFAILHWDAQVDGNNVDFVLGTRLLPPSAASSDAGDDNDGPVPDWQPAVQCREVNLFMIDFGRCNRVCLCSQPVEVVHQLYMAAMGSRTTGRYIPHPYHSPPLFAVFQQAYAETGQAILERRGLHGKFHALSFMHQYEANAQIFLG